MAYIYDHTRGHDLLPSRVMFGPGRQVGYGVVKKPWQSEEPGPEMLESQVGAQPDKAAMITNAKVVIQAAVKEGKPNNVLAIVNRLINSNTAGGFSGITVEGVKAYQKAVGLTADGILGKNTAASMAGKCTDADLKTIWDASNPNKKGVLASVYDSVASAAGLLSELNEIANLFKDLFGGGGGSGGTAVTTPTMGDININIPGGGGGSGGGGPVQQQGTNWGLIIPLSIAGVALIGIGMAVILKKD